MNQENEENNKVHVEKINQDFDRIQSEHFQLQSELELAQQGRQTALEKVDIAIQTAQEEAVQKV